MANKQAANVCIILADVYFRPSGNGHVDRLLVCIEFRKCRGSSRCHLLFFFFLFFKLEFVVLANISTKWLIICIRYHKGMINGTNTIHSLLYRFNRMKFNRFKQKSPKANWNRSIDNWSNVLFLFFQLHHQVAWSCSSLEDKSMMISLFYG